MSYQEFERLSRVAADATMMYARNLLNFVTPLIDTETGSLAIDWEDEIITGCMITRDGSKVHPSLVDAPATAPATAKAS